MKNLALLFIALFIGCSTPTTGILADDEDENSSSSVKSSSSREEPISSSLRLTSSSSKYSSSSVSNRSSSSYITIASSSSFIRVSSASSFIEVEEFGEYTTKDSVAAYICEFNKLPQNYVGKNEGEALYESLTGGTFSKWNFNPWETLGVMIGGDSYSDSDGILPDGTYHEADVDYGNVQSRGTKRLIYQSGCIIYYTADHYASFSKVEF